MVRRPPGSTRTETIFPNTALFRSDIAVESDALDPEFLAEVGNGRVALGHSSLSEPHLGIGEGELAATLASPRAGSGQASHGALADPIPLKLRQCGKNAEQQPARWRRGVEQIGRGSGREKVG